MSNKKPVDYTNYYSERMQSSNKKVVRKQTEMGSPVWEKVSFWLYNTHDKGQTDKIKHIKRLRAQLGKSNRSCSNDIDQFAKDRLLESVAHKMKKHQSPKADRALLDELRETSSITCESVGGVNEIYKTTTNRQTYHKIATSKDLVTKVIHKVKQKQNKSTKSM